ncbi:MAG: erythromycin esterase family protein [Acetobacteraceae bacterium]|nr:erythromycin esterase family protein [Acetobacteraceae bacterium]
MLTDLRLQVAPELRAGLARPHFERAIGVIYWPEMERHGHYFEAVLPDQFDAFSVSTRSTPSSRSRALSSLPPPKRKRPSSTAWSARRDAHDTAARGQVEPLPIARDRVEAPGQDGADAAGRRRGRRRAMRPSCRAPQTASA